MNRRMITAVLTGVMAASALCGCTRTITYTKNGKTYTYTDNGDKSRGKVKVKDNSTGEEKEYNTGSEDQNQQESNGQQKTDTQDKKTEGVTWKLLKKQHTSSGYYTYYMLTNNDDSAVQIYGSVPNKDGDSTAYIMENYIAPGKSCVEEFYTGKDSDWEMKKADLTVEAPNDAQEYGTPDIDYSIKPDKEESGNGYTVYKATFKNNEKRAVTYNGAYFLVFKDADKKVQYVAKMYLDEQTIKPGKTIKGEATIFKDDLEKSGASGITNVDLTLNGYFVFE